MTLSAEKQAVYAAILNRELIPAMGCTEPISVAYAAAKAREILGTKPDKVTLAVSSNIVKNVKSVVVPNTGGQRGLKASVAVGIVAGDAARELEVIAHVTPAQQAMLAEFLAEVAIEIRRAESEQVFDIDVTLYAGSESARVRLTGSHTNVVHTEKNGTVLFDKPVDDLGGSCPAAYLDLTVEEILAYAETADLSPVREALERQICYNAAISAEGLKGEWGACIGKTLLAMNGSDIKTRACAAAAAGSDARMSGCELPVVINSGSGNQGMTASLPVMEYAKELKVGHETLLRALALSNLLTIHLKTGIGCLSAYCGAVCAGCAAAAAIAWLSGGGYKHITHTLVNGLAIVSGIVCDGAKPSCAAKIASSVQAGLLGWQMYEHGRQFRGGDGIVTKGVEQTIRNIGRLGHDGMQDTDREIVEIMTENE